MLILASKSPRRKELLSLITNDFIVDVSDIKEEINNNNKIEEVVMSLAKQKAKEVAKKYSDTDIIIGSDTVVYIQGQILGKPHDKKEAKEMLQLLSGKSHKVLTGVCIIKGKTEKTFFEEAEVFFDTLSDKEIEEYIDTNEPMDKAGSYGIQGKGSKFVKKINGGYFTIVGLPVHKLYKELKNVQDHFDNKW